MVSKPNMTGIPIQMKLDFESGSGQSFEDVQVHYNSEKPARLGALAYTQGTQVYIGPGQERYLPHELGHVVQQKAGLVRPTRFENGLRFNDDPALERQADHIMECGGVLPLSSRPEAVIQRAPGPPGVGIELETPLVRIKVPDPPTDKESQQETAWKGKRLKMFRTSKGVEWAITIDTTPFKPERGLWVFNVEIIVNGRTLPLKREPDAIKDVGQHIHDTLLYNKNDALENIPMINAHTLEKEGGWTKDTDFSVQVTCAMPLDKIYDLLDKKEKSSILNERITYDLSEYEDGYKKERPKRDKEVYAFLLLLAQAFGEAHDPKQGMPLMPRTSLGKIFRMLKKEQRKKILEILKFLGKDKKALQAIGNVTKVRFDAQSAAISKIDSVVTDKNRVIGDVTKVKFDDYIEYLLKLQRGLAKTKEDPIANHPEPLGIGKLLDRTETDLDGKGEFPIFEFRRIGGCRLEKLPDFLGKLNDEIIRVLDTVLDNS